MAEEEAEVLTNVVFNRGVKFTPSSDTLLGLQDTAGQPLMVTRRKLVMRANADLDAGTISGEEFGFNTDSNEPQFGNADENSSDGGTPPLPRKAKRKIEKLLDDYEEKIIFKYLILNFVYIVFGLVTLIIVMVLHLLESGMKEFLVVNHKQTLLPPGLMYLSTIISITLGLGAIISFLLNADLFYKMYERVLWTIFALNLASIIVSFGSWKLFNVTVYQRIFEAETTFVRTKDMSYLKIFKDINVGFWDKLQSQLKCCGMHGPQDWVHLAEDFVDSCCHSTHVVACKAALKEWRRLKKNDTHALQNVLENIYQKDCAFVLGLEVKNLQRDWVIFPSIFAFFNFLLMLQGNFLNRKIRAFYDRISGFESITLFQDQYFCRCLLKYRNMKKPRWQHNLLTNKPKNKPDSITQNPNIETPHPGDPNPISAEPQPNEQSAPENQSEPENQSGPVITKKTKNKKSLKNTPETKTKRKHRSQSESRNKQKSSLDKPGERKSEPTLVGSSDRVKKPDLPKSGNEVPPPGQSQTPPKSIASIITKVLDESR